MYGLRNLTIIQHIRNNMGNRRRSMLFKSEQLPHLWYLANEVPAGAAYLAIWYRNKLYGVALSGYWDSSKEELEASKIGIIVARSSYKFIIADSDFVNALPWTASAGSGLVEGVTTATSSSGVVGDYKGLENTFAIYAAKGGYATAAGHCINTPFPNGSPAMLMSGGYANQSNLLKNNITNIANKFGLSGFNDTGIYWLSTQVNATQAWGARIGASSIATTAYTKSGNYRIRRAMMIPDDNGVFKPIVLSYTGEYNWAVKNGYRSSPLSEGRLETTERIHIKNNVMYQRVRISAYIEGESDAYTSMYVGLLNEDWGAEGRWTKKIYPYEGYSFDNPYVVDFDVPAYGENFIDIRLYAFEAGKQAFYKVEIIDEFPKNFNVSFNPNNAPRLDIAVNRFYLIYFFSMGSYVNGMIINSNKLMAVRLYYYTVGGATSANVFLSKIGASSISTSNYDKKIPMEIIPPAKPYYFDYVLNEGENKILTLLASTSNNNYYFYFKLEELVVENGIRIDYEGDWVEDVYGFYKSPVIGTGTTTGNTTLTANIITLKDNVKLKVTYYPSSRTGNYLYIGKLDINVGTGSSSYSARLAGTNYTPDNAPSLEIEIPTAGSHYIQFMYYKAYSAATGNDAGYVKIEIIE